MERSPVRRGCEQANRAASKVASVPIWCQEDEFSADFGGEAGLDTLVRAPEKRETEPDQQTDSEKKDKKRPKKQPRYHVILWDSDQHSYEYVVRMLTELFAHTLETCLKMATEVDNQGKVIVLTTTMEHAELKRDQIHAYGKDDLIAGCKGSMQSTIEPADA